MTLSRLVLSIALILVGWGAARADESALQGYGLVRVGIACMRSSPSHSSELVSQCVMGTPLKLLETTDHGWWLVESPEGYRGFMIANTLKQLDMDGYDRWRGSRRVMYNGIYAGRIIDCHNSGDIVSDVYSGAVLQLLGPRSGDSLSVQLPDGRVGLIGSDDVITLEDLDTLPVNKERLIDMAMKLKGVAYLWGGTTPAGMDCSGLTKVCFLNQGVILRRDASQQALTGMHLDSDWHGYEPGDLVFFESKVTGNIIHVGIYVGDGLYIHSQGMVKVNSLDENSPLFIIENILSCGSRVIGNEGSDGVEKLTRSDAYVIKNEIKSL
ncbi:MAG: C40 family peptidase [Clostridiales bacterium]|nr:C40 family peptidase [Clostridiales bacterium]